MPRKLDFETDAVAERNRDVAYDAETGGEGGTSPSSSAELPNNRHSSFGYGARGRFTPHSQRLT